MPNHDPTKECAGSENEGQGAEKIRDIRVLMAFAPPSILPQGLHYLYASQHLGQSIAYARMNGVMPPWTR